MDAEGVLQEEDMEGSWTLLSLLASLLMVFGGALPYIPQYQEIQRSSNTEGFSTRVCLVLLVANILRIFFWIGKQFELTLLLQSVVMILTMFAMLHLCCTVHNNNRVSTKQHRLTDLNLHYFWSWSAFEDYLLFCFGFTVVSAVTTLLLLDSVMFVEALGSLAVMFEAMLGVPQLLQNFQNRSTKGMSVKMVLLWTAGDIFKTTYFVMNESPAQFWVCGSVQILVDVAILLQVLSYNSDLRPKLG
ncbi:solute carrier family 66 member 2 [Cyprinodon tularosa]|uniref:Solute carrier family 66 member 2 n=1 Tax=Cyprinodon variegatus TaxID=28743 RepID=A0A3Q2CSL7_CYPVA|nr:PREDICTED: PQ-loop repeat-containing protein 1-like [Cyprinodon variegatus]XP_015229569.1 PREDICTED: PQ-loop repeat-containing protein 1-like [Cyprinodon variegatus]XP_038149932.1 solute carrier family 66 member 2 [Cyprinodon tularosa]XP_038149933.1 solute carrier family 66 member 2 [Cyprinodon tularosa]XP_038149934.1 solute carrier family 66 member 2 [Cyprinodon tularosa]